MISEVTSILALLGGATIAAALSRGRRASPRGLMIGSVVTGLCDLAVLFVSGILREGDGFWAAIHTVTGNLMLPLVGAMAGVWWGVSLSGFARRPLRAIPRFLFLLLLGFLSLTDTWTGYLGPARIDPLIDRDTNNRFEFIHRWALPILIGIMLLFWLFRLAVRRSGTPNIGSDNPIA